MAFPTERYPDCSVVVATLNRATELGRCLAGLRDQSIARDRYEVIVVDDGSSDGTAEVCRAMAPTMPLRIFTTEHRGIAHAKNIGVAAARAPICLFVADDDAAHPDLLWQHITAHHREPSDRTAILGYTGWSPDITVTPLMQYVSAASQTQAAYMGLLNGQQLTFDCFWGGRSSCKTEFLRRHGSFDEGFTYALEDVELGYRLSKLGLVVRYHQQAATYMSRVLDLETLCRRAEQRGQAFVRLATLHPDPDILEYTDLAERVDRWHSVRYRVRRLIGQIRRIELEVGGDDQSAPATVGLFSLYAAVLDGMEGRGVDKALSRLRRADLVRLKVASRGQRLGAVPPDATSGLPVLSTHSWG
jgi:glycosyltransferase involved in cell wall biosynthesis